MVCPNVINRFKKGKGALNWFIFAAYFSAKSSEKENIFAKSFRSIVFCKVK